VNVAYGVSTISVTGTATNSEARVAGNVTDTSLVVGSNTIKLTVTAPDGKTTKVYTVTVVRAAASNDANLSGITLSAGVLAPSPFAPATTAYRVNVPGDCVSSISVTGVANHSAATVAGNVTDTSLVVGNTVITLVVTAENGTTKKTYTVTVVRSSISGSKVTDDAGNCYRTKFYNGVEWMIDNAQKPLTTDSGCTHYSIDRTTQTLNYGHLYSWDCAAANKACPAGWTLPNNSDFTLLAAALNAAADKAAAWADWNSGSALAGNGINGSYSASQDSFVCFWSSTSSGSWWYVYSGATSGGSTSGDNFSMSVRCKKNP
jgi:uncharacterized protein (TIGR02145 family)